MLSRQEEEADRIRTLRNDLKVQEERRRVFAEDQSLPNRATTFHQFAQADAQTPRGRFSAVEAQVVVGANPVIDYPAGPAWCADPGAQLLEPPLGLDNPALDPQSMTTEGSGSGADAPLALSPCVEPAPPLSYSSDPARAPLPPGTFIPNVKAGSPPAQGNSVSGRILRPSNPAGLDGRTELPPTFRRRV